MFVPFPSDAVIAASFIRIFPSPTPLALKVIFNICIDAPVTPPVVPPIKVIFPIYYILRIGSHFIVIT